MPKLGFMQNVSENIGLAFICLILGAVGWQFKDHIIAWLSYAIGFGQEEIPMPETR